METVAKIVEPLTNLNDIANVLESDYLYIFIEITPNNGATHTGKSIDPVVQEDERIEGFSSTVYSSFPFCKRGKASHLFLGR